MQNINVIGQPQSTPPDDCTGRIVPTNTCTPLGGDSSSFTGVHNSLDGLQGGTVNERYHLTKLQHDSISNQLSALMDLVSNQTANGKKIFLQSPQVPTGVSGQDAVNYAQLVAAVPANWYLGPWTSSLQIAQNQVVSSADALYIAQQAVTNVTPFSSGFTNSNYKLLTDAVMALSVTPLFTNNSVYSIFQVQSNAVNTTVVNFTLRSNQTATAYQANYYFVFKADVHQTLLNTWHELKPVNQTSTTFTYNGGTFAVKVDVIYVSGFYQFRVRIIQSVAPTSGTTLPLIIEARKSGYHAQFATYPTAIAASPATDNSTIQVLGGTITQIGNTLFDDAGVQFFKGTPTTYTFSNGLTLSGSAVSLGGVLTQNTTIDSGSFTLGFNKVGLGQAIVTLLSSSAIVNQTLTDGTVYGSGIAYLFDRKSSFINTTSTGTIISRDIADANPGLTVRLINTGATGSVAAFQNTERTVMNINVDGSASHTMSVTAVSGTAAGLVLGGSLKPSANNDALIGMSITPTFANSVVSTVGSLVGGTGYPNGTIVMPGSGGTGVDISFICTVVSGVITSATISNAGANYTVGDVITLHAASGTGATVTVTAITSFTGLSKIALRTYGLDTYDQDYSTSYTTRTKVDKAYVDTAIAVATGSPTGVLSVSVAHVNGISGTSSGGTTPALTLALDDITPTSLTTTTGGATINKTGGGTIASFQASGSTLSYIASDGQFTGQGLINPTAFAARVNTSSLGTIISRGVADNQTVLRVQNYNYQSSGFLLTAENYYRRALSVDYQGSIVHTTNSIASNGSANAYHLFGTVKPSASGDTLIGMQVEPIYGTSTIATCNTLVGGTGHPNGTSFASTTGGSGFGAIFQVVVSSGAVTTATLIDGGINYTVGNVLTIIVLDSSGTPTGTGATITVATINSYSGVTSYALVTKNAASMLAPSTTTYPSLIIPSGGSYSGTQDGSIWYDGTHLYAYVAGAPRQIDRQTVSSTGISAISIATANGVSGVSSGGATPTLTFTLRTSVREVPTGTLNSINVTFTLANTPLAGQEMIFINGILANDGDDYTISGSTITMLAAPSSTDKILASYPY